MWNPFICVEVQRLIFPAFTVFQFVRYDNNISEENVTYWNTIHVANSRMLDICLFKGVLTTQ